MNRFSLAAVVATVVIFTISPNCAKPLNNVSMPVQCANKNFCTFKHVDYPEEIIERLLNGTEEYFAEYKEGVTDRIADDEDLFAKDECDSVPHVSPIYQIRDNANNIRFVVQSEKKFKQIIRIEECAQPGRLTTKTRNLPEQVVINKPLMCVQCKLDYKFVVLSLNGTSLEAVNVQGGLPVCCSCQWQEAK